MALISLKHSAGILSLISIAVPVKRRTLWFVERRCASPASSVPCWNEENKLLQQQIHSEGKLTKYRLHTRNVAKIAHTARISCHFQVSHRAPEKENLNSGGFLLRSR